MVSWHLCLFNFKVTILIRRNFVTGHIHKSISVHLVGTLNHRSIPERSGASVSFLPMPCYEVSSVTNCRLLRLVACCELSPATNRRPSSFNFFQAENIFLIYFRSQLWFQLGADLGFRIFSRGGGFSKKFCRPFL